MGRGCKALGGIFFGDIFFCGRLTYPKRSCELQPVWSFTLQILLSLAYVEDFEAVVSVDKSKLAWSVQPQLLCICEVAHQLPS